MPTHNEFEINHSVTRPWLLAVPIGQTRSRSKATGLANMSRRLKC
jgi:hypothetical protein